MNSSQTELNAAAEPLTAFAERVALLFPRLCRAMVQYESNHVTNGTITLPQLWALELLRQHKTMSMNDLAVALQLKSSSATMLADQLVDLNLVRRTRGATDRRVVQVALTAKGGRALDQIRQQKKKGIMEIFKPLSVAERRNYLAIIEKLANALSQSNEPNAKDRKS